VHIDPYIVLGGAIIGLLARPWTTERPEPAARLTDQPEADRVRS
jgi:hypothetical protein